jgi:DNA-directed RNA polymerase specialized sigma24 family protein
VQIHIIPVRWHLHRGRTFSPYCVVARSMPTKVSKQRPTAFCPRETPDVKLAFSLWHAICLALAMVTTQYYGQSYERGFTETVRFLQSRGAPPDAAVEVAQAAWVTGWERRQQLRNDAFLTTWVNTIALNRLRRVIRTEQRFVPLTVDPMTESGMNCAAMDLARILARCTPSDRVLLEQSLEHPIGTVAKVYGISDTAMRIRLLRARRAARLCAAQMARA